MDNISLECYPKLKNNAGFGAPESGIIYIETGFFP
jgi:hypothetical protein